MTVPTPLPGLNRLPEKTREAKANTKKPKVFGYILLLKTRSAQEWVEATFARLFHNNVSVVISGIKRMKPRSKEAEDQIATVVRYLSNHRGRMNYGAARRAGYLSSREELIRVLYYCKIS
ncbi:conserved domain protein [delta proteobacterium NaphS2]|nr:conserved domain protein [delta proteobacterium NaphS2]